MVAEKALPFKLTPTVKLATILMSLSEYLQKNYFELFQVPMVYQLELEQLKQKQQDFQKNIHPDKYANASQQEQMQAMQVSTQVNTAYQVLSNDLQRAVYLLGLHGVDINAETDTQMPMDFLMKQMEVREALSELAQNESSLADLDVMLQSLSTDRIELIKNIDKYFVAKDYVKAREQVRQFQFIDKLQNEIKQKMASIEDALIG